MMLDSRNRRRTALLVGVSLAGICASAPAAAQIAVLRGAAGVTAPPVPSVIPRRPASANPLTAAQARAIEAAQANQAKAAQQISLAQQARAAARAAVAGAIPNGLVRGGLMPVANRVPAASDLTGNLTWQGAPAPVETIAGGKSDVVITQTAKRAILSWESFNVGADTTLTFAQKENGVAQKDWVALNRVVGQIDPLTGLRAAGSSIDPTQILGSIKADGTVIILNQAGVMFGAKAQVNTHSLLVSSMEIGRANALSGSISRALSLAERNQEFLSYGLLGFRDQASQIDRSSAFTLSPVADSDGTEGGIAIAQGAQIGSGDSGFILGLAPTVTNAGTLTSPNGQVTLQSGRRFFLDRSEGTATSLNPYIRGLVVSTQAITGDAPDHVVNSGIINAARGYVSLGASETGAVLQSGILQSSTSVARNGYVGLTGGDIRLDPGSLILVNPDAGAETIPQSAASITSFKTSQIVIGSATSRIEIGGGSLLLAPSADVTIGAPSGLAGLLGNESQSARSRIFIDSGATIDLGGIKDYTVPSSRNLIRISPVKGNELRDTPLYRAEFLNGTTVLVDPRLSGVRADGVRWIGSPLIEAASYYEQVGVTASELMTGGGNLTLGVIGSESVVPSDIIVKTGANIDISGGWVRYEGGAIQTTRLLTRSGQTVDIGLADPNGDYVGVVEGYTEGQPRFGLSTTYANPALTGSRTQAAYTEGRDAGSLTLKGSAIAFDGTLSAQAYAGARQRADARVGTATSAIYGDARALQGSPSELPASGYLNVQGLSQVTREVLSGAGDIVVGRGITAVSPDLAFGQSFSFDETGTLVQPMRDQASLLGPDRRDRIQLSADLLNAAGLGQLTLQTSGAITLDSDASLTLADGGNFTAIAGRAITIDGDVGTAGGRIDLRTIQITAGSAFADDPIAPGSFDIVVNGALSTRGRWANDFGNAGLVDGAAFTEGGSISLRVAPRVAIPIDGVTSERLDVSGSILINDGALLDVSGGGYIDANGRVDTGARGGDVSLINQSNYFQIAPIPIIGLEVDGNVPGFRVTGNPSIDAATNPSAINGRVAIADGSILAHGFAGGGRFTLETPSIALGDGVATSGTRLGLDFFADTGFADYSITSFGTALLENRFTNGLGGYNALLATQTLTIGAGETLRLTQSRFTPVLSTDQQTALLSLGTGGDLYSVLTPQVQPDAFDRLGANLTLGGLLELHVAQGGGITGDAGSALTVPKLWNEGAIRLIGGALTQSETLPALYAGALGGASLADFFTINADGSIDEAARNVAGVTGDAGLLTNGELALRPLYLTGALASGEGLRLSAGSRIDLSGASIRNPRAATIGGTGAVRATGRLYDGGTLATLPTLVNAGNVVDRPLLGEGVFASDLITVDSIRVARAIGTEIGATIDLSGARDTYAIINSANRYTDQAVWSAGGTLSIGGGGSISGASIDAHGGATLAQGGTLSFVAPTLVQTLEDAAASGALSADQIMASGFDSFIAAGSLAGQGDVALSLRRGFFLTSRPFDGDGTTFAPYLPTISATSTLAIDAPFIRFDSLLQEMASPQVGTMGTGSVRLSAGSFDINGAVLFDRSVASVTLASSGDMRLSGAVPTELRLGLDNSVTNSLLGQLVVNGDLRINARRVYATTGSSFLIASTANEGTIRFGQTVGTTGATPWSAASNLLVQAANIEQAGSLYAPLGTLTLGSTTALLGGRSPFAANGSGRFAPATASVTLASGSVTSVSANGLVIPYGTTTDQIEYYFSPTSTDPLTAPPTGTLKLAGAAVEVGAGSTVGISGGGDVFAYEFVPGTGGSRDVLDRFNSDPYSGNNGLSYADGRQVYAIVPGLSSEAVAAYDPIYGSDYGDLYDASAVGKSVYLDGISGLTPGWYTLLPAKYAVLPGGLRIVEQTGAEAIVGGTANLLDGSQIATGYYGSAATGLRESTLRTFSVQNATTFRQYSNIVTTSATKAFADKATRNGLALPRSPLDAGRIILEPIEKLILEASLSTNPGTGGRGAQADISGQAFRIVSDIVTDGAEPGVIQLDADSLTALGVQSLLIGGIRTEGSDGRTSLAVRASSIAIENDAAHALSAPELLFATDGSGSSLSVANGAMIKATGALSDTTATDYLIDGAATGMTGQGALLRVANGPERLVTRINRDSGSVAPVIAIGAASLSGTSVLIGSSGDVTIDPAAQIAADNIALDAAQISFAASGEGLTGLVITPGLRAAFASADHLTIRSPGAIGLETSGAQASVYSFGAVTFDSAGFLAFGDGAADVTLRADSMRLANSGGGVAACLTACESGSFAIETGALSFGDGTVRLAGFGESLTLTATQGIHFDGVGGFDAGATNVSISAPFIADAALTLLPGVEATLPSLTFATTGTMAISGTAGTTLPDGTPGAKLALRGASVDISGTHLRATAGTLDIKAVGDISLANGAILETPSYAKQFGDAADPYLVSAAGGRLTLTSLGGDILAGTGTTLNVGGDAGSNGGKAGALALRAANGLVTLSGTINGAAPDGGGAFALDTGGSFDLDAFAAVPQGFTGAIDIRTGAGDLILSQGRQLTASSLLLASEAGAVTIGGTIDTSGVSGGDVSLYGRTGVTLTGTARIDASADGYAATDSRQSSAGDVLLGTDDGGMVRVDAGAAIDLRALRPGNRLVPVVRNGQTLFSYVDTDLGGTLTLRAPVIEQVGGNSVDIAFAGTASGARAITVEGDKRWDLGAVAADDAFTGVTITDSLATLDTAQAAAGRVNFLSGRGTGTLSDFIRTFDISAAYAQLGGLSSDPAFVARPGVELTHGGDIKLASNWNFAAADVDTAGALASGVMRQSDLLPGKLIVNPGREAELLENHADFLYRVGGNVHGASGALTLRAGGDLVIAGSVSDGLFSFGDQSDPDYLSTVIGGAGGSRQILLPFSCFGPQSCPGIVNFTNTTQFFRALVNFGGLSAGSGGTTAPAQPLPNDMPFNPLANGAAALGAGVDGAGDPLGSASLFPILSDGSFASSWSYTFVGGADLTAGPSGLKPSIDPLRVDAASTGSVSVEGERSYSYGGGTGGSVGGEILLSNGGFTYGFEDFVTSGGDPRRPRAGGYATIGLNAARYPKISALLKAKAIAFFAGRPRNSYRFVGAAANPSEVSTTAAVAEQFLLSIEAELTALALDPATGLITGGSGQTPTTAIVRSLVRTGTGSITIAAAGDVDLRNGDAVTTTRIGSADYQNGGTAVYTVGHLAASGLVTATDITGKSYSVDPTAYLAAAPTDSETETFRYGRGQQTALAGLFVNDPAYLSGGGDVAVGALGDILGRRDVFNEARAASAAFSFIGAADQPWRVGSVGATVNLRVNPQLFTSGIGALGGGSIALDAGGDISDLTLSALSSNGTADATAADGSGIVRTLVTWGSGSLDLNAGGDLLGSRIDLAHGTGAVSVAGSIRTAGALSTVTPGDVASNLLRVRVSDARINFDVGGSAQLQGVAALAARGNGDDPTSALNSFGFYSATSAIDLVANGRVSIADSGASVVTGRSGEPATAVYPATVNLASLTGDLVLNADRTTPGGARTINLFPSATGQLRLFAGGDINSATIVMEDRDPGLLPGFFSLYSVIAPSTRIAGQDFNFPVILPDTSSAERAALHNSAITHAGDAEPVRIAAGGDALDLILSLPKQARISAGRDIVNMMLFNQNLTGSDITRVVAGRDIIATTQLTRALLPGGVFGDPLPALQGNTFVIGGPGAFFLEAGRDAGPFLNSAVVDPSRLKNGEIDFYGSLAIGGGVLSLGNEWNPALPETGADLNILFGVSKGSDYAALRDIYVNPANVADLPDDLFMQVDDGNGNQIADRDQPIYGPVLLNWMKANAADVLTTQFGGGTVTAQQAYDAFLTLPELRQRGFLIREVYFNELEMTSRPDGPSYLQYSRGYRAVNTLFSPELGYTENNLEGGTAGASETIATGNLDLRLATIQTARGGDIALLGPGGRILAGSTVRTSEQAARRSYDGARLYAGDRATGIGGNGNPQIGFSQISPAAISAIPTGYEGIITLRGGRVMSFTDTSLLLNQSRLFTQGGGDITLWSSNGDLNAGQGPKSAASFPPVVVRIDENAFSQVDAVGGVSGAGIAAFAPAAGVTPPDVFLIAPRGTVDAGDAGVRVAGNLFVAAAAVSNADNFQVGGTSIGVASTPVVDAGAVAASNAASAAASQAAQAATAGQGNEARSQIFVDVQGFAGGDPERCKQTPRPADCPAE